MAPGQEEQQNQQGGHQNLQQSLAIYKASIFFFGVGFKKQQLIIVFSIQKGKKKANNCFYCLLV